MRCLIVGFFICFLPPVCSGGLNQCLDINSDMVCMTNEECLNISDCVVECNGVSVILMGRCGSVSGVPDESFATDIMIDDDSEKNMFCWCMILSPLMTKWVLRYEYSSGGVCEMYCARGCSNAFLFDNVADKTFRTTIFNNVMQ